MLILTKMLTNYVVLLVFSFGVWDLFVTDTIGGHKSTYLLYNSFFNSDFEFEIQYGW